MKATVQTGYGPLDEVLQLRDVDRPVPGDDEVLVRVRAASVHPDVWHVVTGRPFVLRLMGAGLLRPKTEIPGTDVAGIVEAVGDAVTRFAPGDEVFGETFRAFQWRNGGAYAEYVAAPEDVLAHKPAGASFEQAASVATSGLIVLINLPEWDWLADRREVLINGAGGGVGTVALQILEARAPAARITAVDRVEKLDLLRSLGADRVVDCDREDFTLGQPTGGQPTDGGQRYDFIFDVPGNHPYSACRRVLTPEGRYVLIGHEHFGSVGGLGRRVFGLIPLFLGLMTRSRFDRRLGSGRSSIPGKREAMEDLRELLGDGTLRPVIDRTFPLEEVPDALLYLASGRARGKILITP